MPPLQEATVVAAIFALVARLSYVGRVGAALRRAERFERFDPEEGHQRWMRFRRTADTHMNVDGIAFIAVVLLSAGSMHGIVHPLPLQIVGGVLVVTGIGVKVAAHRVVGDRGYYWHNFFCPTGEEEYIRKGIYRYVANPMYGPGNLHLIGLPLLFLSWWGLGVGVFYILAIWGFHLLIERPHTINASKREVPTRLSLNRES